MLLGRYLASPRGAGYSATAFGNTRIPMSFGTWLFTRLHGDLVGTDSSGNRYFVDRRTKGSKRERRWVMYQGVPEASKVMPEWHAWLHGVGLPPTDVQPRAWQKPYEPNLTGTDL